MDEIISRKAWILTRLYKPKKVAFKHRYRYNPEEPWVYVRHDSTPYCDHEIFHSKGGAIEEGYRLLEVMENSIASQIALNNTRRKMLDLATEEEEGLAPG